MLRKTKRRAEVVDNNVRSLFDFKFSYDENTVKMMRLREKHAMEKKLLEDEVRDKENERLRLIRESACAAMKRDVIPELISRTDDGGYELKDIENSFTVVVSKQAGAKRIKRAWSRRPDNWRDLAYRYQQSNKNIDSVLMEFNLPEPANRDTFRLSLARYLTDYLSDPECKDGSKGVKVRPPITGWEIEKLMVQKIEQHNRIGMAVNNQICRSILTDILNTRGEYDKFMGPDSDAVFGNSWCQRFWVRNKLASRRATTKMREVSPEDYDIMRESYLLVFSKIVKEHEVPDALIINYDETASQLTPSIKRTRCHKSSLKVRVLGHGHEKPQVTAGITVNALGHVVADVHLIFGGKTKISLPGRGTIVPPVGSFWDVTKTHWQTPSSFKRFLRKSIIPYRERTVAELGLPEGQKMIFLLDLHHSHFGEGVLNVLKENSIIPVFIPGGCTDRHQVLDVIVNKPFKNAITNRFIMYLSEKFEAQSKEEGWDGIFRIDFALGTMKPLMPEFVKHGIDALRTDKMVAAIKKGFAEDALLLEARMDCTYERACDRHPGDCIPIIQPQKNNLDPDSPYYDLDTPFYFAEADPDDLGVPDECYDEEVHITTEADEFDLHLDEHEDYEEEETVTATPQKVPSSSKSYHTEEGTPVIESSPALGKVTPRGLENTFTNCNFSIFKADTIHVGSAISSSSSEAVIPTSSSSTEPVVATSSCSSCSSEPVVTTSSSSSNAKGTDAAKIPKKNGKVSFTSKAILKLSRECRIPKSHFTKGNGIKHDGRCGFESVNKCMNLLYGTKKRYSWYITALSQSVFNEEIVRAASIRMNFSKDELRKIRTTYLNDDVSMPLGRDDYLKNSEFALLAQICETNIMIMSVDDDKKYYKIDDHHIYAGSKKYIYILHANVCFYDPLFVDQEEEYDDPKVLRLTELYLKRFIQGMAQAGKALEPPHDDARLALSVLI
jgi:hypothetical protein